MMKGRETSLFSAALMLFSINCVNAGTWTTLGMPSAIGTHTYGISGSNIVGVYSDASGDHGFLYTIPEPATLLLLGLGGFRLSHFDKDFVGFCIWEMGIRLS